MRSRWPIVALLCVLASLLVPGIASASTVASAENRVRAFDLADQVRIEVEASLTLELAQGCELAQYDSASDSLLAAKGGLKLADGQAANLARFNKKLPKGSTGTHVDQLGDGVMFTAEVPGRVPGSRAVYQKAVDANGVTTSFTKTTFDPQGNIVHIKDKLLGGN